MRLARKAVQRTSVAVAYELVKFCCPVVVVKSRKQAFFVQKSDPPEVLTGVQNVPQLVLQLRGIIADAAVQIHKIAVEIVEDLDLVFG